MLQASVWSWLVEIPAGVVMFVEMHYLSKWGDVGMVTDSVSNTYNRFHETWDENDVIHKHWYCVLDNPIPIGEYVRVDASIEALVRVCPAVCEDVEGEQKWKHWEADDGQD